MNPKKREAVYNKLNGHCGYCGKKIDYKEMQVDHMLAKRNGGTDDLDNLMPACRRCNHYKRSMDVEDFREYLALLHERIAKDYIVKVGLDYGIVKIKPFDNIFHFEKMECEAE